MTTPLCRMTRSAQAAVFADRDVRINAAVRADDAARADERLRADAHAVARAVRRPR